MLQRLRWRSFCSIMKIISGKMAWCNGTKTIRTMRLRNYLKSEDFLAAPTRFATQMNAEEFCNMCITLINQATYMLRKLIERQQQQFLQQGGIREQMYNARVNYRGREYRTGGTGLTGQTGPTIPTSQTGRTSQTRLTESDKG